MRLRLFIGLLCSAALSAQQFSLKGIVDLHLHTNPDSDPPRRTDVFTIARAFRQEGMRAFVIKSHYMPTAQLAWATNQVVPEVGAYGGIVLNRAVGGINPEAVDHFARVTGNYARIVWLPTMDAENWVTRFHLNHPFVPVTKNGVVLPEVIEVLKLIKKYNLTFATGHSSAEENLLLIREARKLGIDRIIVTHAMPAPVAMTIEQMKQAAAMGAQIEFVYNLIYPDPEEEKKRPGRQRLTFTDYVRAIRAVGPEHCFLSSDVGQPQRPIQPEAWKEYYNHLIKAGLTVPELDMMSKRNPARLIGLQ